MEQRTDWIDYGKGIGIILVVYAHLLSSGYNAGLGVPERFFLLSDSIVYSFHMPLFFFLAGLLAERSYSRRGARGFLVNKVRLLAYPYIIWSFLQAGIELFFSQHSQRGITPADLMAIPYLPWSQFWFLYALLLMNVSYVILKQLGRFFHAAMVAAALVLFFFPVKTGFMALNGFSTGFLFFTVGVLLTARSGELEKYSIPFWCALLLFPLLTGGGYYVFTSMISPVRLISGTHPLYFLVLSAAGIAGCIGLAQFLAGKRLLGVVKMLGTCSLQIYLVHMLVGVGTRIVLMKFLGIDNPLVNMIVGVGAGLTLPVLLYSVSMKMRFPYLFKPGMKEAVA